MDIRSAGSSKPGDNAQYRVLVDAITDYAIILLDEFGIIQTWNGGAERLTGRTGAETIGTRFGDLFAHPSHEKRSAQDILTAVEDLGKITVDSFLNGPRQGVVPVSLSAESIVDHRGAVTGFAVTFEDREGGPAQDYAAPAILAHSEDHFRRLVQSVSDYAIFMLSPEGNVVSWNAGGQQVKGYTADEIIGSHLSRFYTEEDRSAGLPHRALNEARDFGNFKGEGLRVRKDGTRFWASVSIDAIRDDAGELVGFSKITRDISERIEQQKSLEMAREELFQLQKTEAIGQLTGGIAHDFNNLLMVVLASLEVLKRRIPSDERNERLIDNAYQAAQRGAQLTKRMLAFARKQDLEHTPVDLSELVRNMSALLSRTLGQTIMIETRFPASVPLVMTDANQLDAALLNLAVNARDAMPDGGNLLIAAEEEQVWAGHARLAPGRYVRLSMTDTGEGMDPQTLARAIDPFFTTKGVGKGTGLGLSMVQGIAEQSGGMMQIRSQVGQGTTVELWLRAVDGQAEPEVVPVAMPEPVLEVPCRKLKVLAVDDDALVLLNTSMMLEDLGHQVVEAHSGAQALKLLEAEGDIDLVITDQSMPRMTGVALAREILARWPQMPIALASGYADIEQAKSMNLPRLAKPFTQAELEKLLERLLDQAVA